jgi:hypothetical protein
MRGNYYLLFVIDPKIPLFGKEGEGRFSDNFIFRKIPPNLPFPKGGILFSCPFVSRRLVSIPAKAAPYLIRGRKDKQSGFRIKCGMTDLYISNS